MHDDYLSVPFMNGRNKNNVSTNIYISSRCLGLHQWLIIMMYPAINGNNEILYKYLYIQQVFGFTSMDNNNEILYKYLYIQQVFGFTSMVNNNEIFYKYLCIQQVFGFT